MALRMSTPWKHPKTGVYWFRKAVPMALRDLVGKLEITHTLRTKDPQEAISRFLPIAADVDEEWARLRALLERRAEEQRRKDQLSEEPLSAKQIQGLAGEFYRWFVSKHDDNPGSAKDWEDQATADNRVMHPPGRLGGGFRLNRPEVEQCLKERGIALSEGNLFSLLWATGPAGVQAKERLARMARHDYSEEPASKRFPKWSEVGPTLKPTRVLTLKDHWDEFAKESITLARLHQAVAPRAQGAVRVRGNRQSRRNHQPNDGGLEEAPSRSKQSQPDDQRRVFRRGAKLLQLGGRQSKGEREPGGGGEGQRPSGETDWERALPAASRGHSARDLEDFDRARVQIIRRRQASGAVARRILWGADQ